MLIYFLRHGDASSHSRFDDNERPLTDLGHKQAAYVGKFLQYTKAHINIILTSPLTRACETGAIVQSFVSTLRTETSEYLLNGTHPKQLFKRIAEFDVESALLVGHEPFLSDTISLLIGGDHKTEIEMKKCNLALVEVLEPIRPGTGILKQLLDVETISKFIKP
jgi:phosphohistidine phosphatase